MYPKLGGTANVKSFRPNRYLLGWDGFFYIEKGGKEMLDMKRIREDYAGVAEKLVARGVDAAILE